MSIIFGGSQGPYRFSTIPLEFGYEITKFYKNKIAVDGQVGSYFMFNSQTGQLGRGSVTSGDISWTYQMNFNRSFSKTTP